MGVSFGEATQNADTQRALPKVVEQNAANSPQSPVSSAPLLQCPITELSTQMSASPTSGQNAAAHRTPIGSSTQRDPKKPQSPRPQSCPTITEPSQCGAHC